VSVAEIHQPIIRSLSGHCQCIIKNHLKQIKTNMSLNKEFYYIRVCVIYRYGDVINHPRILKFCLTFKSRLNSQLHGNKFMFLKILKIAPARHSHAKQNNVEKLLLGVRLPIHASVLLRL
jgi:hypothetical protein